MKILLSCSGGYSSSLIADNLKKEAKKEDNIDITIKATGVQSVADDLKNDNYDIVLLAPQSIYEKDKIQKEAQDAKIKFLLIPRDMYNPIASAKLYSLVKKTIAK